MQKDELSSSLLQSSEVFIAVLKHYNLFRDQELYKVVCPFHGDVNPSLQINIPESYWYCFGCGLHGSTFELVKAFNPSLNSFQVYQELNKILKGRGDYRGVGYSIATATKLSPKLTYTEGIKLAKDYYYNLPDTNWYKPIEEANIAKRYMLKRGFTTKSLINIGAKATYNTNYPIVFPLLENGMFRGYVLRTTDKNVEANRKYMYNSGFKRKLFLVGTYKKAEPILLVEGYLDFLAAKQLGIENVAAILGWKISNEQLEKIKKKGIKHVICGLDNAAADKAGKAGYEYLKRIAIKEGFIVSRIKYPKGIKDFGDLLNAEHEKAMVLEQIKNILKK